MYLGTPWGIELILKWRVAVRGLRNILSAMSRLRRLVVSDRWFDRALRTVREYHEKVDYIHLNR